MNNLILEVKNLNFSVNEKQILKNISFDLEQGDFLVLIGSNGCGKSSLLKCINQTYQFSSGNVSFLSKSLTDYKSWERAQQMTTFTQNIYQMLFKDLSVIENCVLYQTRFCNANFSGISSDDYKHYKNYLATFDPKIAASIDNLVGSLSGGQQQQLALSLCLEHPPKLLILDEHTSALDPKTSEFIMDFTYQKIVQGNISCIMTTHNLEYIKRFGSRILAMKNGELLFNQQKTTLSLEDYQKILEASY